MSQALTNYIRVFPKTTTTVIGVQIPEPWLPTIPGVRFVRLTNDAARTHLQQCGRLLFINAFNARTSDAVTITIADASRCSMTGLDLRFERSADGWHLKTDGVPGGVVSGKTDCGCQ